MVAKAAAMGHELRQSQQSKFESVMMTSDGLSLKSNSAAAAKELSSPSFLNEKSTILNENHYNNSAVSYAEIINRP